MLVSYGINFGGEQIEISFTPYFLIENLCLLIRFTYIIDEEEFQQRFHDIQMLVVVVVVAVFFLEERGII